MTIHTIPYVRYTKVQTLPDEEGTPNREHWKAPAAFSADVCMYQSCFLLNSYSKTSAMTFIFHLSFTM